LIEDIIYITLLEIIFYGRGGQGAVTGAQMLAGAAILSGQFKDCSSFPSFGAERRGAPVEAYCRISDQKIWARSAIQTADIAIILDEAQLGPVIIEKLKPQYKLIVNTNKSPQEIFKNNRFGNRKGQIAASDLISICIETKLLLEGQPVVNTPILGMIPAVISQISFDHIAQAISAHFGSEVKAKKNIEAAKIAAERTCVLDF
jgi:2-oxoacid:acceptor oxidoreductase gamma subunit (pyruvate/2-ketoisovalerate family)